MWRPAQASAGVVMSTTAMDTTTTAGEATVMVDVAGADEVLGVAVDGAVASSEMGCVLANERLFSDLRAYARVTNDGEAAGPAAGFGGLVDVPVDEVELKRLGELRLHPAHCRDNLLMDSMADVSGELERVGAAFGRTTIVDLSPRRQRHFEFARHEELAAACKPHGVTVITGTGLGGALTCPQWARDAASKADVAREERLELTRGVAESKWTRCRPGIIGAVEVLGALDDGTGGTGGSAAEPGTVDPAVAQLEEKLLRGAALAMRETGAPLALRVCDWRRDAAGALRIIASELQSNPTADDVAVGDAGPSLDRVLLVDVDVTEADVPTLVSSVLNRGACVCLSGLGSVAHPLAPSPCNGGIGWPLSAPAVQPSVTGNEGFRPSPSDLDLARVLVALCRRGFAKQVGRLCLATSSTGFLLHCRGCWSVASCMCVHVCSTPPCPPPVPCPMPGVGVTGCVVQSHALEVWWFGLRLVIAELSSARAAAWLARR